MKPAHARPRAPSAQAAPARTGRTVAGLQAGRAPRRFLFVGGGTGGHLAPALGLAEALQDRGHELLFLGSGRAVERAFFPVGTEYRSLGLDQRRVPRRLAWFPACYRAWRAARGFRPDVVVSLGGLAGSTAVAARQGRPLVLLEGNRVVGKGVRLLQPWAQATFTLFPETADELRGGVCVGPIGRRALAGMPRATARQRLGLPSRQPTLLVTGGSQGAAALNEAVRGWLPWLAEAGVQLIALTGAGKAEDLRAACSLLKIPALVFEHYRDMGVLYSAADLALCRGGAATMAELWLAALPAIVVPFPHHKDRQQELNARALEPGVTILPQRELGPPALWEVLDLLTSPRRLAEMSLALEEQAPPNAIERAVELMEEMAARKG